jgi:hypothetical protein
VQAAAAIRCPQEAGDIEGIVSVPATPPKRQPVSEHFEANPKLHRPPDFWGPKERSCLQRDSPPIRTRQGRLTQGWCGRSDGGALPPAPFHRRVIPLCRHRVSAAAQREHSAVAAAVFTSPSRQAFVSASASPPTTGRRGPPLVAVPSAQSSMSARVYKTSAGRHSTAISTSPSPS